MQLLRSGYLKSMRRPRKIHFSRSIRPQRRLMQQNGRSCVQGHTPALLLHEQLCVAVLATNIGRPSRWRFNIKSKCWQKPYTRHSMNHLWGSPSRTLDLPIAGRGYSALPFVYELVNWANNVPDHAKHKSGASADTDGADTIRFLNGVSAAIGLMTGIEMKSLGLHPVVYFYTRGGEFQPAAFIATAAFMRELAGKRQLAQFTRS